MKRRKIKPARRQKTPTRPAWENYYNRFFAPLPTAVDGNHGGSLEQPSPYRSVPSVVTYGVGECPIVGYVNA